MTRKLLYLIVIILQVVFLVGMVAMKQRQLVTGFPVRLSVQPIDPNDLMRGQYVSLGYEISRLDLTKLPHDPGNYKQNQEVFVSLSKDTKPDSSVWIPKSAHNTRPSESEFPYIKGRVQWVSQWSTPSTKTNELQMDYSIGQYFVQQGRAGEIQSAMRPWNQSTTRRVSVEVRLAKDGSPAISKLFIDEKEFR